MVAMRRKKQLSLLSLVIIVIVVISLITSIQAQLSPADARAGKTIQVTIAQGDSAMAIAEKLQAAGLIRNAQLFYYYVRLTGQSSDFRAGNYAITADTGMSEWVRIMTGKQKAALFGTRVTIPEGYTAKQVAARLEAKGVANASEFMAVLKQPSVFLSDALQTFPKSNALIVPLEGYLFPETYVIPKNSTEKEIAQLMISQLDSKLQQLPNGWETQLKNNGVSLHQALTIASLVEREVVVPKERAIVASVIYNRLKIGQALQIDATVQYLLGKQKARLYYADLEVASPYNTYKQPGLPPGPIANPSLASIEAALYPAKTDYYYYVTKKNGTSEHLFAKTYKEHLSNIAKSKQ